ncbi:MAG: hypothetical protein H8F28_11750, partial [Fibrella sp.]|nr:hypothetical protein [Armatimonadota bacterium]
MIIRHVTSPDDMGTLQRWWLTDMPEGKKLIQRWVAGICINICIICGLAAWLYPPAAIPVAVVAVFGIVVSLLVSPNRIRRNASVQTVKLYKSGENAALFGERTLEINEDGILSISTNATSL